VGLGDVDVDAAEAVAREIGGEAFAFPLDIADRESFAAFLDEAEKRHGPLSILVNNAGVDWVGPFHEEPDEVTRREIEVNLCGTALGSKLALARMLPR
jgi:NAD(P)-dependent dehydrogenase (short-subunit alcohol dehydrogenase family)